MTVVRMMSFYTGFLESIDFSLSREAWGGCRRFICFSVEMGLPKRMTSRGGYRKSGLGRSLMGDGGRAYIGLVMMRGGTSTGLLLMMGEGAYSGLLLGCVSDGLVL